MSNEPTYEMFTTKMRGGVSRFLDGLTPGVPTRYPSGFSINSLRARYNTKPFKFTTRTINGEVWVCRLKDEDSRD